MERQLGPIKLLLLLAVVAGLGYVLRPTFNTADGRQLVQGKITKVSPACGDQSELLSTGKIVTNPGNCSGNSSIILDNAHVITTGFKGETTGEPTYDKFDSQLRPGQQVRAIVVTNKSVDRFSLGCETCRVWVSR